MTLWRWASHVKNTVTDVIEPYVRNSDNDSSQGFSIVGLS